MKSNIGTIIKKELARFFGDKKLFFTTVLMPGLMIYIMYTLMGNVMQNALTTSEDYVFQMAAVNMPEDIRQILESSSFEITDVEIDQVDGIKTEIVEKTRDICVIFPESFSEQIADYDVMSGLAAPEIKLFYISTETNSATAKTTLDSIFAAYEEQYSNKFDVNASEEQFDLATKSDMTGKMVSMLMPMLILILLFSGCVALAPDSIAGEKERGTIATLLVTPVKRSEIAIGKIISLSIMTILSGLSSFLGIMLSLPKLVGEMDTVDAKVYQPTDYIILLLILLSTVLFMISVVTVISGMASSVKEAGTIVSPLTILIAIIGVSGMFASDFAKKTVAYVIPLFNSVQCMNGVFSFEMNMTFVVITVVSNLLYSAIFVFILAKMFESEKMMFSK